MLHARISKLRLFLSAGEDENAEVAEGAEGGDAEGVAADEEVFQPGLSSGMP